MPLGFERGVGFAQFGKRVCKVAPDDKLALLAVSTDFHFEKRTVLGHNAWLNSIHCVCEYRVCEFSNLRICACLHSEVFTLREITGLCRLEHNPSCQANYSIVYVFFNGNQTFLYFLRVCLYALICAVLMYGGYTSCVYAYSSN